MILFLGLIVSVGTIFYNFMIFRKGLLQQDPLSYATVLGKKLFLGAGLEIGFLFWSYLYVEDIYFKSYIAISLCSLLINIFKIEGYKYLLYVITPVLEIIIVFISFISYLI